MEEQQQGMIVGNYSLTFTVNHGYMTGGCGSGSALAPNLENCSSVKTCTRIPTPELPENTVPGGQEEHGIGRGNCD